MPQTSKKYTNSILLSSARSGTNYFLAVYSKMFPNDMVLKEIFRKASDSLNLVSPLIGKSDAEIVELAKGNQLQLWTEIITRSEEQGKGTIAKIFYYHTQDDGPLMQHFRDSSTVIHLIRRNLFDVYVSSTVARQTGRWQSFVGDDSSRPPEPFAIERTEIERFFRQRTEEIRLARAYFVGRPNYHEVFYEDIADDVGQCASAIGRIFAVNVDHDISVKQRKQKALPNSVLVTNYSEVKDLDISS